MWSTKKYELGSLIHVKHGYAFKSAYFSPNGTHIVLTPGNFYEQGGFKLRGDRDRYYTDDYPAEYLLSKGDLIVAMTEQGAGLLGSCALVPEDDKYLHNQRLGLITVRKESVLDKGFLYYLFNTEIIRRQVYASATGVKVRHTAPERIYRCKVELPPLEVQQRIAGRLSAYDELAKNNLKCIKLLEEVAQLTYEQWFLRLEFPGHEHVEIDDETNLPKDWSRQAFSSLGEFLNGYAFKPSDLGELGYPVIKIKEIKNGVVDSTPRNPGERIADKYLTVPGDIIFSWSGSLEVVIWLYEKGLLNQHLFKVTPNSNIPKSFLYLSLKHALVIFDNLTTGATMKHIKRKELDFVKAIVPTPDVLTRFSEVADTIIDEIVNLSRQNHLLQEERDFLLPRLTTGMIDIDNLEANLP